MAELTAKQISKAVYYDYLKKFVEDPTHFNASMKFLSWGDYVEDFEPDYKPEHLEAIRKAENKYNSLVDAGRGNEYWRTCSECRESFSGKQINSDNQKEMICGKCKKRHG